MRDCAGLGQGRQAPAADWAASAKFSAIGWWHLQPSADQIADLDHVLEQVERQADVALLRAHQQVGALARRQQQRLLVERHRRHRLPVAGDQQRIIALEQHAHAAHIGGIEQPEPGELPGLQRQLRADSGC